ncbi:hypothetical protein BDF14DRAFT_84487 [Spinellus fusiger]|nr:hypothetical protein BDF14DRAFT_84487 [Spinellus fusiger]
MGSERTLPMGSERWDGRGRGWEEPTDVMEANELLWCDDLSCCGRQNCELTVNPSSTGDR